MDTRLYEVKLANHKIFKDLKQSLADNPSGKLRNLIELKDDVIYAWHSLENCLLALNLEHLEQHEDETPYQKLHFLSPPSFSVERVMTSPCGSRICVWGSRGVTVAELPSRWGRGGLFDSGNTTILCKSYNLDERFLYCQGEIRRVQWHPTSLSHVFVLISDNTLRLYNIALKNGPKLVKIFPIGPKPSSQLAGRPLLDSLGDVAVDFTAVPDSPSLLILRGDGDVYMMDCNMDNKCQLESKLTGPLAMYPPADDNYGTESCSIRCLGGGDTPPLVVVATCSAALYHCLLLPNPTDKEDSDSHALYVVEAVELSMVLNPDDDSMQYNYPVHLYPCTNNTYACLHAGGVHTVTIPILANLVDYALADDAESDTALSAMCSRASSARHLVCTAGGRAPRPPVGLALLRAPPAALVLCDDGTLLTRTLEPYDLEDQLYKEIQLKNPALEQDDINSILRERQKLSFVAIVQEILSRGVSQPILNIDKAQEPGPKECLELVSQATLRLRGEYMCRLQRCADAAARKLLALRALAARHAAWLAELQKEIDDVQQKSASLREKCLLAEKVEDDIKYRCSAVIRSQRAACPATAAERGLLAELRRHQQRCGQLTGHVAALRALAADRSRELENWQEEYKKKDVILGKSHSDTISSILQQQTSQISTLIEETKLLKDQLSIV